MKSGLEPLYSQIYAVIAFVLSYMANKNAHSISRCKLVQRIIPNIGTNSAAKYMKIPIIWSC